MTEPTKAPEAEVKPAKAPAPAAAKAAATKAQRIFPVYGVMHDPETGVTYDFEGVEVEKVDPWVQSQIDAKKMRVE